MEIAYIIMLAIAVVLLLVYTLMLYQKKKQVGLLILHISVCIVNLGYLLLSVSTTVDFALIATKITYLGQILVINSMFFIIIKLCGFKMSKVVFIISSVLEVLTFALVCTAGYLPWYYKEVVFVWENGGATLHKEYGPLHITYLLYVVSAFIAMFTSIIYSLAMKKKGSHKHAGLLIAVVGGNIAMWIMEKFVPFNFEFLSVSYIMSELVFIFFFWTMQDYVRKDEVQSSIVVVDSMPTSEKMKIVCSTLGEDKKLTIRQTQILELILNGKTRKEIASKLIISENTVKMHTSMLYDVLGVKNKEDIFAIVYKGKQ